MFYEGRIQFIREYDSLESLLDAVSRIFAHNVVYCFRKDKQLFGIANDQRTCECVTEAAILNLTKMTQIESVTLDWLEQENWLAYFTRLFNNPYTGFEKPLDFTISGNKITSDKPRLALFECGCCGTGFHSDYQYQVKFDQDAGYGICPDCEKWH